MIVLLLLLLLLPLMLLGACAIATPDRGNSIASNARQLANRTKQGKGKGEEIEVSKRRITMRWYSPKDFNHDTKCRNAAGTGKQVVECCRVAVMVEKRRASQSNCERSR